MSVIDQVPVTRPRGAAMEFIEWSARSLAKGMLPGLIAGVIAGGVGSRLAMRIMTLTSHPAVRGLETDFGATVGEITLGGTLFLVILGGILGMAGGILYLAIRPLLALNGWLRGLAFGLLLLALIGRFLVDPGNPDFLILSPAGLAVVMFSALPILYGLLFVPLYQFLKPRIAGIRRPAVVIVPVLVGLVPLILAGGVGALVIAAMLLIWQPSKSIGEREKRALRVGWFAVVLALVVWRGAAFVSGVADIL